MASRAEFVGVVVALLVGSLLAGLYWRSKAAQSSQRQRGKRSRHWSTNTELAAGITNEVEGSVGRAPLLCERDMSQPAVRSVEHPMGAAEDTLGDWRTRVGET